MDWARACLELPPYLMSGANPHLADLVRPGPAAERGAFTGDVMGSKGSAIYRAHSYATKVPAEAIQPFIEHYTRPGGLVLDPFCGSGMTGVAALMSGRAAVLADISPAATFLAANYCLPVEPGEFGREAAIIQAALAEAVAPLYLTTCPACAGEATLAHALWSEVVACPDCGRRFAQFEAGGGHGSGRFSCPACAAPLRRGQAPRLGETIVRVAVDCPRCGRVEAAAKQADAELARQADAAPWPQGLWHPIDRMLHSAELRWGELWRSGYHRGMDTVDAFFCRRSLRALSELYRLVGTAPASVRGQLLQAFLDIIRLASRLRRPGAGQPTHSLYVPGVRKEANVARLFAAKCRAVGRALSLLQGSSKDVRIATATAADLRPLPSASVDYCFTDPPFGGSLIYSELNFLAEAWLGAFTPRRDEAIIAPAHGKGLTDYGALMTASLAEIGRVLKPGAWLTLVFHHADASVWNELARALAACGFSVGGASLVDKGQESFKATTAPGAVHYDVALHCQQGGRRLEPQAVAAAEWLKARLAALAAEGYPDGPEREARMLHARLVQHAIGRGALVPLDFRSLRASLAACAQLIDGYWYLA